MKIKNLQNTSLEDIVNCMVKAFADYFVKISDDVNYWEVRYRATRVDFSLSYGMFDGNQLVGLIINGIDVKNSHKYAFNTGTGVLPKYRGQRIVDQLYENAIPKLKEVGVTRLALEVIQKNDRAIRVYERIGFQKMRNYLCFKGDLLERKEAVDLKQVKFDHLVARSNPNHHFYSWDHCNEGIQKAGDAYQCYEVFNTTDFPIGFFIINTSINYIAQLELYAEKNDANWNLLFSGIRKLKSSIRLNNIDQRRETLVAQLLRAGLENHINQFEMEMKID